MTIRKRQKGRKRPDPATVVPHRSRKECTYIKVRRPPTSEITPDDIMEKSRRLTYMTTRFQTKTRRSTHRRSEVSKLTKTTEQKLDKKTTAAKPANNGKPEHVSKHLTTKFAEKKLETVQEVEPKVSNKAHCLSKEEMKLASVPETKVSRTETKLECVQETKVSRTETTPKCVQEANVSKEETKLDTVQQQNEIRHADEESDMSNPVERPCPKTHRSARGVKHDYAQLAGIKRRSPSSASSSPELPRFARKARRRGNTALKRTREDAAKPEQQNGSCKQSVDVSEKHDDTEGLPSPKELQATSEHDVTGSKKRQMDADEKSSTKQRRTMVRNSFLERDSRQKTRKRLLKNGSSQKSTKANEIGVVVYPKAVETCRVDSHKANEIGVNFVETPAANECDVIDEFSDAENNISCELDYYVDEAQTSPEFVKYFHDSRRRPKPDPDVYNWPSEWLPKPDTLIVPANTSALEIDPPVIKPPCHVFENTFYLQSPPKMRSEMERWKFNFDFNPDVEKARTNRMKETERQLLAETAPGRRRTKAEKLAIKKQATRMVDTEDYLDKMARYNERKKHDMEIMRGVYRQRGLGEPLDTEDIAKMAMDIKRRVYLKSMRIANPGHILVKENETDNGGDANHDFTIPDVDTITNEARNAANKVLQESEVALERDLGVVVNVAEIRPEPEVNYVYESYKMERNRTLDHSYSDSNSLDAEGGGGETGEVKPTTSDPTQRMTLWYGHEKHRKLKQYEKQKHVELMADFGSVSKGYESRYDVAEKLEECQSSVYHDQDSYENEAVVTTSNNSEREEYDDEEEYDDDKDDVLEEEVPFQPHTTLWYGQRQGNGDDEDEAVKMMCGGSQKRKFDDNDDDEEASQDEFHNAIRRSALWNGHGEHEADSVSRGTNRKYHELESKDNDKMVDDEDENDENLTYTRTVPFLYLTTEDLPLRVRTQTYKFKRSSRDTNSPDVQIDR